MTSTGSIFGDVIHTYTRAQAIEDGVLIDVTPAAREAGFTVHAAMTRAAWTDTVEWTEAAESRRGFTGQSEEGRLWDVLTLARYAAARATGPTAPFTVHRVPATGRGRMPRAASLVVHIGPGDTTDPVLTIMAPGED